MLDSLKQKLRDFNILYKCFLRLLIFLKPISFNEIDCFCLFIGYPRSGHTIIGALLDAHPEIVISIEADVLGRMQNGYSKNMIFRYILRRSQKFITKQKGEWTKYSYKVSGQYQGKYNRIKVIGDKKGAKTTSRLISKPFLLKEFEELIGKPIKMIHVIRDPFDSIATIMIKAKEKGRICDEKFFKSRIEYFFNNANKNMELMHQNRDRVLTIYHEDFVKSPQDSLIRILKHLNISYDQSYLEACSRIVYPIPNITKNKIYWPENIKAITSEYIKQYPFFRRYL
jgi:hypothetical protein